MCINLTSFRPVTNEIPNKWRPVERPRNARGSCPHRVNAFSPRPSTPALSTLCRSKALSCLKDCRITLRSDYGFPYYKCGDLLQLAVNTSVFRFLTFLLYLYEQLMGLALEAAQAKLPDLYGSNQTIPHTRVNSGNAVSGKVVPVHTTKSNWRTRGKLH
jgi:hypothetical protein